MRLPLPRLGKHKKSILIIALGVIGSVIGVYIYHIIVPTQISPGTVVGYLNRYDTRGHGRPCYDGPLGGGGHRATCRAMIDHLSDKLDGATDYGIIASPVLGPFSDTTKGGGRPDTGITSGGPGSFHKDRDNPQDACCGITIGVHNTDGTVYVATEDWTGPSGDHTYLCDDSMYAPPVERGVPPCSTRGYSPFPGLVPFDSKTGKGGLYGMQVPIEWHVKHVGNDVHYIGVVNHKQVVDYPNPKQYRTHGPVIDSAHPIQSNSESRVRVDSAGYHVNMGMPYVEIE
ncbi:MAG: hypothetical protein WCC17_07345 [Candidatus Nitrosopolaris sp.]